MLGTRADLRAPRLRTHARTSCYPRRRHRSACWLPPTTSIPPIVPRLQPPNSITGVVACTFNQMSARIAPTRVVISPSTFETEHHIPPSADFNFMDLALLSDSILYICYRLRELR